MLHFKVQLQQRSALYTADGIWDLTHWTDRPRITRFPKDPSFPKEGSSPMSPGKGTPGLMLFLK